MGDKEIEEGIVSVRKDGVWRPNILDLPFCTLSSDQSDWRERPFIEEKVKVAILYICFYVSGDEISILNGFSIALLKHIWD